MEDGFSCILHFLKFSGGGPPDPHSPPLIKGIHQLNPHQLDPQNFSSTTTAAKGKKKKKKKKAGKAFPIKTIYKKFMFRLYRN